MADHVCGFCGLCRPLPANGPDLGPSRPRILPLGHFSYTAYVTPAQILELLAVGLVTGIVGGLLGIGGGNISVPLLQRFARLPLRQCIATTAAFMCISASVGAVRKNLALPALTDSAGLPLGLDWHESLRIAACLAPTAVLGGLIGGRLTHILPLRWVRLSFILLLAWAALDMLGVL